MVRRSTWILLVVFAILVGFTYFFQKYQGNKAENAVTATPTLGVNNLYNIDSTQVKGVVIANSEGKQIELYIDPVAKKWEIKDVPAEKADSFQIESIMAQLFSIQIEETITNTTTLDSFGLTTPAYTITMTTSDDKKVVTSVGAKTAISSGYYVRVGDGTVVLVGKDAIDNVVNMITAPPLVPTATPETAATGEASPSETPVGGTPTP